MARLLVSRSLRPAHQQVCWWVILLGALVLPHLQISARESSLLRKGQRGKRDSGQRTRRPTKIVRPKRVRPEYVRKRVNRTRTSIFEAFQNDATDNSNHTNPVYATSRGAFLIELPQYGPASMAGYETCDDMKADLIMAAKFQVNGIIARNVEDYQTFMDAPVPMTLLTSGGPPLRIPRIEDTNGDGAAAESTTAAGEDSFGTNNQEEGVEEADVVKSDGTFVYAAYGDFLVVWRASTGQVLQKIQMPAASSDASSGSSSSNTPEEKAFLDTEEEGDLSFIMPLMPPRWGAVEKPQVRALLLDEDSNRLVVVVTQYDGNSLPSFLRSEWDIVTNNGASQVRTYEIDTTSSNNDATNNTEVLSLLAVNDLPGDYQDARSIGSNAHLVTMTNINTYNQLEKPLHRGNFVEGMSDEDYIAAATIEAETLINTFVDHLMEELDLNNDTATPSKCKNMVRVSMFQTGSSSDDDDEDDVVEQALFSNGLLRGFLQIHSFDMSALPPNDEQTLDMTSVAGCFLPSRQTDLYASDKGLLISARGSNRAPGIYTQMTYLMGFHLGSDGTATPGASGQVTGHPLNSFSFDLKDGYLRIATTSTNGIWFGGDTNNQVTILEYPTNGTMTQVGFVDGLGHPGETIHAVRFIGDVGYVVTFRRTDPFYTIDLSNPKNASVVGELNVTGFSSYLHPMDNENEYLLAIGQEVDPKTGRRVGLKISVFDVRDLSNPQEVTKYIMEQSESDSQWEHKSFRYLKESNVLILPASVYRSKDANFDGFLVFDAKVDGIKPMYNVSHVKSFDMSNYCWYSAYLSPRSMVVDGKLTTMKGHTVQSHNLADGNYLWDFNMDKELEAEEGDDCYGYWPVKTLNTFP